METLVISESHLTIENRTFSGGLYARMPHPDGGTFRTFRTATVLVMGNDIHFKNCTFENTAGPGGHGGPDGQGVGQALALYLDGDGIVLEDCVLKGYQDTLFLAPLPEKEIEKGGFTGPGEFLPRTPRSVRLLCCRIEGSVDFVFGGADAVFEDCEFVSLEPGYVFAPCSLPGHPGFTAINCRFTAGDDVPEGSCYIARPWRNDAAVTLKNCELGAHIAPEGWHDWGKTEAHATVRFTEEGSYGPGAECISRPAWVTCN